MDSLSHLGPNNSSSLHFEIWTLSTLDNELLFRSPTTRSQATDAVQHQVLSALHLAGRTLAIPLARAHLFRLQLRQPGQKGIILKRSAIQSSQRRLPNGSS